MPFLELTGCEVYYEVHGDGPALVFAHGRGGNHLSWWQQILHFRDRYRCVTFAHRGFAPSTVAPGAPVHEAFADDLAALIDHLQLTDVRLVAQSMGGWTALGYALRFPARVRALVMASTTGGVAPLIADDEAARLRAERPSNEALVARGISPATGERMAREQPALAFLYEEIRTLRDARLDRPPATPSTGATPAPSTPVEALAALSMPVLCIAGEEDTIFLPATLEAFAARVANGRCVRVPRAAHSVYFERAPVFNQIVDQFLAWLSSPEPSA